MLHRPWYHPRMNPSFPIHKTTFDDILQGSR